MIENSREELLCLQVYASHLLKLLVAPSDLQVAVRDGLNVKFDLIVQRW